MPEESKQNIILQTIDNLQDDLNADQIVTIICEKLVEAGRTKTQ